MANFGISKCSHNHKCPCGECEGEKTCGLPCVFCDADAVAKAFLEETLTQEAKDFLHLNRKKHRIVITAEVLGEIVLAIIQKSGDPDLIDTNLANLQRHVANFIVSKPMHADEEFREISGKLLKCEQLRCGTQDRVHIAAAVCLGCRFFTFDTNIISDRDSIQKLVRPLGRKFELYKLR